MSRNYEKIEEWRMDTIHGDGAGHYYNDRTTMTPDYADGWYIRRAKGTQHDVRELLIDWEHRKNRLQGELETSVDLHRALETGYNQPTLDKLPHLDYRHKRGRFEHLYRRHVCDHH